MTEKTATETLAQQEAHNRLVDERRFEGMMRAFFENWAPEDRAKANMFHSDLHVIIRAVHADAHPDPIALVKLERERCAAIVQLAREGEIDQDLRSIIHRIENP